MRTEREKRIDYVVKATFLEIYGPAARTILWRSGLTPHGDFLLSHEYQGIIFNWRLSNDLYPHSDPSPADKVGPPTEAVG